MNSMKLKTTALALALTAVAAVAGNVPANVTFTEHIAPILFQNCTRCHRPGEVAPFSLLNFQDAKKHARQMVDVTESRTMPPWHAGHGYIEFSNERRLTDDQIALLGAWVKQGSKEGDPAKLPALPKFTASPMPPPTLKSVRLPRS